MLVSNGVGTSQGVLLVIVALWTKENANTNFGNVVWAYIIDSLTTGGSIIDCWFLICSDGVTDGLWNKNIAQCFAEADQNGDDAEKVAKRILAWALDEAGIDDTTLFVVRAVKGKKESSDVA